MTARKKDSNKRNLFTWLGGSDFGTAVEGPVLKIIKTYPKQFQKLIVLNSWGDEKYNSFLEKLQNEPGVSIPQIERHEFPNKQSTDGAAIYDFAKQVVEKHSDGAAYYNFSGGNKLMGLVWVALSIKTGTTGNVLQTDTLDHESYETRDVPIERARLGIPLQMMNDLSRGQFRLKNDEPIDEKAFEKIKYKSRVMENLVKEAQYVANLFCQNLPIFIGGETGTGKELLADAIAQVRNMKKGRPYLAINCGSLSPELAESELFGHKRGAFTGAMSDHKGIFEQVKDGIVFLDEVGELPPAVQVKLLRVLQTGEFRPVGETQNTLKSRAKIISATHKDLRKEVKEGRFREDLYHRLVVYSLYVPAFNERGKDCRRHLIESFWEEFSSRENWPPSTLSPDAIDELILHNWPGNIRELRNALQRLHIRAQGGVVTAEDVQRDCLNTELRSPKALVVELLDNPDYKNVGVEFKRQYMRHAYAKYGTQQKTAKALGISKKTVGKVLRSEPVEKFSSPAGENKVAARTPRNS